MQMLNDRILVKRTEAATVTKGGIIIPDSYQEKGMTGTVVAIGKGRILENGNRVPLDVKIGDEIMHAKYAGSEVKIKDETFLILSENDVWGIL